MAAIDGTEIKELVESAVTAVSILGGAMAYFSGFAATRSLGAGDHPEILGQSVNEGLAQGFVVGSPLAMLTLIIEACT